MVRLSTVEVCASLEVHAHNCFEHTSASVKQNAAQVMFRSARVWFRLCSFAKHLV